ncbi:MAG: hypothetical protein ACFFET_16455 [Candidatus Thorarchaeota archaeon]
MRVNNQKSDLYGVSPVIIAEVMAFVTLFTPYAVIPAHWAWLFLTDVFYSQPLFYSLLWVFTPRIHDNLLVAFIHPEILWSTGPYSLFNIVFALKVVRYYQGKANKPSVIKYGLISLLMPSILLTCLLSLASFDLVILGLVWPIPIQFLVGLALLHFVSGPTAAPEEEESIRKVSLTMEELDEMYE